MVSGNGARLKGQRGEREFLTLLSEHLRLDEKLTRNLTQTRSGGADCIQLPNVAIEVKNCATIQLNQWWQQTCEQASELNLLPVLAYKISRKGWYVVVPFEWVLHGLKTYPELTRTAQIDIVSFTQAYKKWH